MGELACDPLDGGEFGVDDFLTLAGKFDGQTEFFAIAKDMGDFPCAEGAVDDAIAHHKIQISRFAIACCLR